MSTFLASGVAASDLAKLRQLLQLIAELRALKDPLTSPEGLRKAIELLLGIASILGLDEALINKLRTILADERVFQLVLAVVGYLTGVLHMQGELADGRIRFAASNGAEVAFETRGFFEWLPIVLQILELIRTLVGERLET